MGNTFEEIIQKRHSIRHFSEKSVSNSDLQFLFEAARLAPSSNNKQPWRFIAVRDKTKIEKLARAVPAGIKINAWMENAPCVIVCCGEESLFYHKAIRLALPVDLMTIDVAIAIEHIVLSATERGMGTCWVGWFSEEKVRKIINIPSSWKIISLLALGWPSQEKDYRKTSRKSLSEIAFLESPENPLISDQ